MGEMSVPSRSGQALSTPSKTGGGPRSKQAAVASMFKAAKMSSGSNTTLGAAAAPIAVAASSAGQPQASSEDSAENCRATSAGHRENQVPGNWHPAAANDSTTAADPAARTDTSRWHDASCQLSSAADEGRPKGHNGGQTNCITTDTAAAAAELAGAAGNTAGGLGAPDCSDEPCSSDAQAAEGNSLNNVDLAEQKRIMHELWLERNALSARIAAKRTAPASKTGSKRSRLSTLGKGKQTQLSAMLTKAPPP